MSGRTKARAQRIAVVALVLCASIATFFGVLQVKRNHELVRFSYQLSDVSESVREAESANRRLRLERSLLTSPERLQKLAEDIGMVQPQPDQIRVLEVGNE